MNSELKHLNYFFGVLFLHTTIEQKIDTTIRTVSGNATYSHTEIEDKDGNWNDNWYAKDGEYVIHEGKYHHVYII